MKVTLLITLFTLLLSFQLTASTSIPFILCEQTKDGDEEVLSGGLYDLLQNPNEKQIFKEFQEEAIYLP